MSILYWSQIAQVTQWIGDFFLKPNLKLNFTKLLVLKWACQLKSVKFYSCLKSYLLSCLRVCETSIHKSCILNFFKMYSTHSKKADYSIVAISPNTYLNFRACFKFIHYFTGKIALIAFDCIFCNRYFEVECFKELRFLNFPWLSCCATPQ